MDFTLNTYKRLLNVLINADYTFQSFSGFLEKPAERVIILRHDVDARKLNSLKFAEMQQALGVKGTYYFRIVPQSFDEEVIKRIADLGHEIGYHYEDMDLVSSKLKSRKSNIREEDLFDSAINSFQKNLNKISNIFPVNTICMHGSPRSKFDNKALWKKYNYKDYGIIGEPYFDIDFNDMLYLTDTGRMWNGDNVSIRDKICDNINKSVVIRKQGTNIQLHHFHTTNEIINAVKRNELPDKIMMTFHPQRWTNNSLLWLWELVFQSIKNQVKGYLVKQKVKVQKKTE